MLEVVRMNTSLGDRSFAAAAPRVWNGLSDVVRNSALSEDAFAKLLKTYLMMVGRGAFDVELAPYEINLLLLLLLLLQSKFVFFLSEFGSWSCD